LSVSNGKLALSEVGAGQLSQALQIMRLRQVDQPAVKQGLMAKFQRDASEGPPKSRQAGVPHIHDCPLGYKRQPTCSFRAPNPAGD